MSNVELGTIALSEHRFRCLCTVLWGLTNVIFYLLDFQNILIIYSYLFFQYVWTGIPIKSFVKVTVVFRQQSADFRLSRKMIVGIFREEAMIGHMPPRHYGSTVGVEKPFWGKRRRQ